MCLDNMLDTKMLFTFCTGNLELIVFKFDDHSYVDFIEIDSV